MAEKTDMTKPPHTCPYCDAEIAEAQFPYCEACGFKTVPCPGCGLPVASTRETCPHCGCAMESKETR
jgi:predicted amidophosphoribosyltransferase